jgi:hypothetical protein
MADLPKAGDAMKASLKELEMRTLQAELLAREAEAALRLYEAKTRLKQLREASPRKPKSA